VLGSHISQYISSDISYLPAETKDGVDRLLQILEAFYDERPDLFGPIDIAAAIKRLESLDRSFANTAPLLGRVDDSLQALQLPVDILT
jgi:hypothetical protein